MTKHETINVRMKRNGKWQTVQIRVERKRSAPILDRLIQKHRLIASKA